MYFRFPAFFLIALMVTSAAMPTKQTFSSKTVDNVSICYSRINEKESLPTAELIISLKDKSWNNDTETFFVNTFSRRQSHAFVRSSEFPPIKTFYDYIQNFIHKLCDSGETSAKISVAFEFGASTKNIVAVFSARKRNNEVIFDIKLYGSLQAAPEFLINFIQVALRDDSFIGKHWGKLFVGLPFLGILTFLKASCFKNARRRVLETFCNLIVAGDEHFKQKDLARAAAARQRYQLKTLEVINTIYLTSVADFKAFPKTIVIKCDGDASFANFNNYVLILVTSMSIDRKVAEKCISVSGNESAEACDLLAQAASVHTIIVDAQTATISDQTLAKALPSLAINPQIHIIAIQHNFNVLSSYNPGYCYPATTSTEAYQTIKSLICNNLYPAQVQN